MALPPIQPSFSRPSAPETRGGWDRGILGGEVLPGTTTITRGGVDLKRDPKKRAGADGGRPTYHGIDSGEIDAEVEVTTDEQLQELLRIVGPLVPQAKKGWVPPVKALEHPQLHHLGAVSVAVRGVSEIKIVSVGRRKLTIRMDRVIPPIDGKTTTHKKAASAKPPPGLAAQAKARAANPRPSQQAGIAGPTERQ